jgi:predicted ATPase
VYFGGRPAAQEIASGMARVLRGLRAKLSYATLLTQHAATAWQCWPLNFKQTMTSISKLIVGGFKSIRERTEIPIAPLTLLFGPNSAGKSSVMDAMDALRQRLDDARWLHASNVMSTTEDLNRIIVNFDPKAHRIGGAIAEGAATSTVVNLGMEITAFCAETLESAEHPEASYSGNGVFLALDGTNVEIELNAVGRHTEILSRLTVNGQALLSHVSPTWVVSEQLFDSTTAQLHSDSGVGPSWTSRELGALVIDLSNPHWLSIEQEAFLEGHENYDDYLDELREAKNFWGKLNALKAIVEGSKSALIQQLVTLHGSSLVVRTRSQIFRAESWSPDVLDFEQRGDLVQLLSTRGIALTKQEVAEYRETKDLVDWIVTTSNALTFEVVMSARSVLDRSVVSGDRRVLTEDDVTVQSDDPIFSEWPLKSGADLKRYALAFGEARFPPDMPNYPSDFVNDVFSGDLFMGIGYQVTPAVWSIDTHALRHPDVNAHGGSKSVVRVQLFLKDSHGRVLNFDEVGSGISYVMPVLASLWHANMSWISQPELHLHPEAQCNMGDVLIRAFNRGKFSVTETHSEHLLLRMLRRIRQTSNGTCPDAELKCLPEQVSVLYFEPTVDGCTRVRPLRVTRQGDFMDRWPSGFFEERGRELFDE